MGSDFSCLHTGRMNTFVESGDEYFPTDGEQTEFQAEAVDWAAKMSEEKLQIPNFTVDSGNSVSVGGETRTSPSKTECDVKSKARIYSSNVTKNCVNLIQSNQKLNSVCSTRFNSRSNSRCVSPRQQIKAAIIG